jgi:hypothetical protein
MGHTSLARDKTSPISFFCCISLSFSCGSHAVGGGWVHLRTSKCAVQSRFLAMKATHRFALKFFLFSFEGPFALHIKLKVSTRLLFPIE